MLILENNTTFLVFDNRVIRQIDHATLQLGAVKKHENNPLFIEEFDASPPKHWEVRYDNMYPNVFYDEDAGLYKCWYSPMIEDGGSAQYPVGQRFGHPYEVIKGRKIGICYASSEDGIHWIKPELDLFEYQGSTKNNLVMKNEGHGAGIFKDHAEKDPDKRYKMFFCDDPNKLVAVSFSPDGLHWSQPVQWSQHEIEADTHNNAFWDDDLQKYVGYTRTWSDGWYQGVRVVARSESPDFLQWSKPVEVFQGKDAHDQIYSMPVFKYANLYIGLPAVFHYGNKEADDWDKVSTELAWSPDTLHWHRLCPGDEFIPRGPGNYPDGAYDCGCVYAAANPVIMEDEIRLYYGGSNGQHTSWREGSFNLATMRIDGFAGLASTHQEQISSIQTNQLNLQTNQILINADIQENGFLRVGIQDEDGNQIPEFTLEDCDHVEDGDTFHEIQWKGKNVSRLLNRTVSLSIEMRNTKVYSIRGSSDQHQ